MAVTDSVMHFGFSWTKAKWVLDLQTLMFDPDLLSSGDHLKKIMVLFFAAFKKKSNSLTVLEVHKI